MSVLQQLRERVSAHGAISVADYMDICNRHYYATRDPFGKQGDFTTAPEISQIFGELIGAWLAETWMQLGSPKSVLCEAGPGRGTLMSDILRATRDVPGFHAAIRVRMIETSPVLQAIQKKTLQGAHADIEWKTSFDELPSLSLLLVANEFFDALPIHQFMKGGVERMIGYGNDRFYWMQQGSAVIETSPVSLAIMTTIAKHIKAYSGAALMIDYGYENHEGYRTSEGADTLQALKDHAYVDALSHQGEIDLTAHVDFGELARVAKEAGANASPLITQGDFLRRLGAELRAASLCRTATEDQRKQVLSGLARLISPEEMGTLFRVLAVTSLVEKLAGF